MTFAFIFYDIIILKFKTEVFQLLAKLIQARWCMSGSLNKTTIASYNGQSPVWQRAITLTNDD